jgi:hypothetical protein
MIGFIGTSVTISLNYNHYSTTADLHTFQFTFAHALGFSIFTSPLLATDLNTETSTSDHCEVFLPFLVQSPWNIGTQLKLFSAESESESYITTNSQSASLSWNKAPIWGLRPYIYLSLTITALFLWASSLTRGRV